MKRAFAIIALATLVIATSALPALAHHHARHHVHTYRSMAHGLGAGLAHMLKTAQRHRQTGGHLYVCGGCVVRTTLAGVVAVSAQNADRIVGTINALYEAGFRGLVKCAASGGHVAGSLHYSGNACDMAQRGWGKTVAMMYHAHSIIAAHGMRDGCSFRDCGHIDMGFALARRHHHVRYAYHHRRAHYASGV